MTSFDIDEFVTRTETVRYATATDLATLRRLQTYLAEYSPELLDYGVVVGDTLVSVTGSENPRSMDGDGNGDDPGDSAGTSISADAPDSPDDPVGYLLPIRTDGVAGGGHAPAVGDGASAPRRRGQEVHVAELVVAPAHRRAGHATALLDALFASLEPGTRVTLAVAPDNDPALALYDRYGFEQFDRREDFFDDGPALLFEREA